MRTFLLPQATDPVWLQLVMLIFIGADRRVLWARSHRRWFLTVAHFLIAASLRAVGVHSPKAVGEKADVPSSHITKQKTQMQHFKTNKNPIYHLVNVNRRSLKQVIAVTHGGRTCPIRVVQLQLGLMSWMNNEGWATFQIVPAKAKVIRKSLDFPTSVRSDEKPPQNRPAIGVVFLMSWPSKSPC